MLRNNVSLKNIFSSAGVCFFALAFVFLFSPPALVADPPVLATDKIDVEYLSGINIGDGHIFNEDNIYPGWEKSETIQVKNQSTTDITNLYFKFKIDGSDKLAEKLKLYVVRVAGNSY